jgi:hypothetical protein
MRSVMRHWPVALWLSAVVAFLGGSAFADSTGNGSKNFRVPPSVPNYFSNEAGPMLGGPAESRRVDLYPNPAIAPRQPDSAATTSPWPRTRHIATGHARVHIAAHTRIGRHPVTAARGHTPTRVAARGGSPSHAKHPGPSHTTRVSSSHHRARG